MRKEISVPDTPFTSAHTLIKALAKSLTKIRDEGIENVWARHRGWLPHAARELQSLGFKLFANERRTL